MKILCNLSPSRIPESAKTLNDPQHIGIASDRNRMQERVERIGINAFDMIKTAASSIAFLIGASHVSEYFDPQHKEMTSRERVELIVGQYGASVFFGGISVYEIIRITNDIVARRQLSTCNLVTRVFNIALLSGSALCLSACAYFR